MSQQDPIGYHNLTRWRRECFERFGNILDMKYAYSPFHYIEDWQGEILDVGAGVHKSLKQWKELSDDQYYSLDNDPAGNFSYRDFAEIPADQKFDLVVMSQFLEHLDLFAGIKVVRSSINVLKPGGRLFIGIPNPCHPVRYHADVTHLTNWPYNDLYGMLKESGLEVTQMWRSNKARFPRNPLKRWIINTVCRHLRIDWCDTFCVLAKKPEYE